MPNYESDLDAIEAATQAGNFLKWADGPHTVSFREGPEIRTPRHWIGSQPSDCEGKGCQLCASGNEPKRSFLYQCWDHAKNADVAFDLSKTAQKYLTPHMRECQAAEGAGWREVFAKLAFKCEKRGSGAGTSYSYTPVAVEAQSGIPF